MNRRSSLVSRARVLSLFALVAFGPAVVEAKTLYVNGATGNDSVTYEANSESNPWRTIGRAAWGSTNRAARNGNQAARAGDVVLVAAGTYSTAGTGSRNEIAYLSENSGTAGNPIVFRAVGVVQLTLSSGDGPVIGAYSRNYITWDGFRIHEGSAPSRTDTGSVTVYGCTGCTLQNLDIDGSGSGNSRQDNHNGIRIEGSRNITVRNSRITNVYNASNPNNGACIMTYAVGALLLENNDISYCGAGIFIKGGPNTASSVDTITIRYNYLHDIGRPGGGGSALVFHAGASGTPERPILVYQNIVNNVLNDAAVRVWPFDNNDLYNTARNIKVFNNTMINARAGLWISSQPIANAGIVFQNNIAVVRGGVIEANATNINDQSVLASNRNVSSNATWGIVPVEVRRALAQWQGATGQDANSVSANPGFVGALDFHLTAGSPARTAGRALYGIGGAAGATIPAGAYITGSEVIGLATGPVPSAPTNLRIQTQP